LLKPIQMKKQRDEYFAWVIAYIDSAHLETVSQQLAKNQEYAEVEAYIPTIKILKKQFKGKEQFDEVPLLFNYGFFKIPRKYAIHAAYLEDMQKNISAIFGWVKDPAKALKSKKLREEFPDKDRDLRIPAATATSQDIADLIKASLNIGAHNSEDLSLIKPGDIITLRGYPFDGVEAEFVEMDEKRKKVKVKISALWGKQVEVAFDNVFFTIYHSRAWDDSLQSKNSLDEMSLTHSLDRLTHKIHKRNETE
jgi:transcription antitermination factor NusG